MKQILGFEQKRVARHFGVLQSRQKRHNRQIFSGPEKAYPQKMGRSLWIVFRKPTQVLEPEADSLAAQKWHRRCSLMSPV
ncbi:hypothetical protein [Uliginosibacterium flavum]|uniref:Uncharacterized protein n=1 Tax=Uliginosibacterium flavum TaxID=1396831 RepID=A0ABV2TMD1_9RHOO